MTPKLARLEELAKALKGTPDTWPTANRIAFEMAASPDVILELINKLKVACAALEFYADKKNWGTYVGDDDSGKNALLITKDSEHYSDVWVGHRARKALEELERE